MGSAFKNCTSLTDIPNDFLADCPNVTNVTDMFNGCSGITGRVPELWKISTITSYRGCFEGCVNAENYGDIPYAWKN
jgi:hypothetical protein